MSVTFGTPLATREFIWQDDEGGERSAFADIGLPKMRRAESDEDSDVWYCAVRLRAFGDEKVYYAAGEDSVQAIHLALVLAGALVARCPLAARTDYAEVPNYGFPTLGEME